MGVYGSHAGALLIFALLFGRAFLQVGLVAYNVRCVSQGRYARALVSSFGISAFWWFNAHAAAHVEGVSAPLVYATGAALGCVAGMALGSRPMGRRGP